MTARQLVDAFHDHLTKMLIGTVGILFMAWGGWVTAGVDAANATKQAVDSGFRANEDVRAAHVKRYDDMLEAHSYDIQAVQSGIANLIDGQSKTQQMVSEGNAKMHQIATEIYRTMLDLKESNKGKR